MLHDEQGHPVADALVIVLSQPPGNDWDSLIDWDELGEPVTTDEHGEMERDRPPMVRPTLDDHSRFGPPCSVVEPGAAL